MADTTAGDGRGALEQRVIQRSLEDEDFRLQLLADPKTVVERELGARLPEGFEVRAVEETADTVYLVIPSASPIGGSADLSDRELESVAGGWAGSVGDTCPNVCPTSPPGICS